MKNTARAIKGFLGVLGRVLICAVFIAAAAGYALPNLGDLSESVAARGILTPKWMFIGTIGLLVVGILSVVVGCKARIGASLLLAILVLVTYHAHGFDFWTLISAQARHEQIFHLVASLSTMGAMLFIVANGPGQMSLDGK